MGLYSQNSFVVQPKVIAPPFLKVWLMEVDRKIPSIRYSLDQNSALIMECGEVERKQVKAKKPWFLSSTHFLDWNKGHFCVPIYKV